jgi:hypothetical protein
MSNRRKLQLQPYTPPRQAPVIDSMGVIPPDQRDTQRCKFHPDCCDPDDMDCPGCGQPAHVFIVLSNGTHVPFCADHMEAAAYVSVKHRDQINAREGN